MASDSITERIEAPKLLDEARVRQFVEEGFLVVEGLVSEAEVEELRADIVAIARGAYPCEGIEPAPSDWSDQEVLEGILCIHQPHYISPVMLKYVKHPSICGVLSQITAAHLPWWDGSVKCMQSMLFVKPPQFQGQAWHQDEIYIPTRDRSLIGAWIALDDATIENGCLWVIPGSHKTGYLYPQRAHNNADEFDFAPESYGFDENEQIPVEVKTGTVVFFNGYLLHRSLKNRSNIYRRVLVNHYCNAWSFLPWSLREGETVATADRRCIVPVAGIDPYAWKGYEEPPQRVWLRTCKAAEERRAARTGSR
ncbi:protein involved in biosynthesis of mitomycin antibiotics/polyketide fumonisin [Chthonomonas calidirosea]|uniref:phytanoyl-CoA dioxygenase family protein n=1 Tax=Chthonomonas calidirosea TaxID=454171 RepID=UPI0006DD3B61|nr:phytanoyl-CoA dioxygenase family protein [Chthonomonas calidirosea]CEK12509.1 protein involved in biosynthesis of mitomycin antibiotics/polyketide fumonisin [Chthonomonas calidirosea]